MTTTHDLDAATHERDTVHHHTDLMTAPTTPLTAEAFAERFFAATLGAMELQAAYLGGRLGWYQALAAEGPLTSVELAHRTRADERYAREWLEHQAASGYLVTDDAVTDPKTRRYHLPAGHAEVLTNPDSLAYLGPLARFVAATSRHLEAAAEAYRTGGGVSWEQLGDDAREAQAALNRPLFLNLLAQEILPAIPGLDARLRAGARVADIGCGEGWSSIGIALGYPCVTVDGYDVDVPSVQAARRHAAGAGVTDRVAFNCDDVSTNDPGGPDGPYDAVFAFECLHDMPDPVAALAAMRRVSASDGYVIVMDELSQPEFTAPAGPQERLLYGYSLTNCLLDGMSQPGSAATGTVMRPDTMHRYATDAGFSRVEILPVDSDAFRFYRLHH